MADLLLLDVNEKCIRDQVRKVTCNKLDDYYKYLQCDCFDIARSNMQYNVMTLENMIFGIMNGIDDGVDFDDGLNGDGPYVITTPGNVYGASCIVNNEFMDKVHEAINEDFFIIPSSVHEVIVFPASMYDESMKDMIHDVNSNIVSAEDVLSDNMFAYIDGELKIA